MAVVSSQCLYLKAIYEINQKKGKVRNKDIASELSFSKPSVTLALQKLAADNLVIIGKDGNISLTEEGTELALKAIEKNTIVYNFFVNIGASHETAYANARIIDCQMSNDLIECIKKFNEATEPVAVKEA